MSPWPLSFWKSKCFVCFETRLQSSNMQLLGISKREERGMWDKSKICTRNHYIGKKEIEATNPTFSLCARSSTLFLMLWDVYIQETRVTRLTKQIWVLVKWNYLGILCLRLKEQTYQMIFQTNKILVAMNKARVTTLSLQVIIFFKSNSFLHKF